ncbi:MAG: hypothetical protein EOO04_05155 [Chitinophagaceae bacterium]|nr:MAG: hypothetical protein EOO04_05155 [Chitinophagaceae bacterium]
MKHILIKLLLIAVSALLFVQLWSTITGHILSACPQTSAQKTTAVMEQSEIPTIWPFRLILELPSTPMSYEVETLSGLTVVVTRCRLKSEH